MTATPFYLPLTLSRGGLEDDFDSLTRSMRDLTSYADLLARAVSEQRTGRVNKLETKHTHTSGQSAKGLQLQLRPHIEWRETADGFVLSALTPGLPKDQLKLELLDVSGEAYIEIAAHKLDTPAHSPRKDKDAPSPEPAKEPGSALAVRARYGSFCERVRVPRGVDREAMSARYEDGLLVVTMPRAKAEGEKRRKIAIS